MRAAAQAGAASDTTVGKVGTVHTVEDVLAHLLAGKSKAKCLVVSAQRAWDVDAVRTGHTMMTTHAATLFDRRYGGLTLYSLTCICVSG